MITIRIVGLISVALLTMGSGGIKKSNADGTKAADVNQEIENVSPIYEAAPSDMKLEGDLDAATMPVASSANAGATRSAASVFAPEGGSTIELALSEDYIQGRYYHGGGFLGVDSAEGHVGFFFSDDRDIIGNVGMTTVHAPLFVDGLTFSAGARGYIALLSNPNDDVFGIAPGVEARYAFGQARPMSVVGSLFYSPNILTLGDAKNIVDFDLRYEVQIIPSAVGFIGYRNFRFDSDEGKDKEAAENLQIGARFAF